MWGESHHRTQMKTAAHSFQCIIKKIVFTIAISASTQHITPPTLKDIYASIQENVLINAPCVRKDKSYCTVLSVQNKKDKRHHCNFCPYSTYYTTHLRNHLCKHTGERPYQCLMCNQGFSQKMQLKMHFQHHSDPQDVSFFLCAICFAKFKTEKALYKHCRTANH